MTDSVIPYLVHAIRNATKARDWDAIVVLCDELEAAVLPHAPPSLDASSTAAHYDDIRAAVRYVAVGEDEFGIWVARTDDPYHP